jgi:hypothetical protein
MGKKVKKAPSIKDKRVSPIRTICEVHRELHDILLGEKNIPDSVSDKMIALLEEAYIMGKKMDNKLRQYKYNYDDGWWKKSKEKVIKEKLKKRGKK